ncbi:hypothetical protein [Chryseobacterium scophthalmum]|uniref:hypothetical protein n=1 Tax=Chryseobacterium scophthalmum TaxID=59733 RepID=UPI003CFFFBF3
MNKEIENTRKEFIKWTDENRHLLPLNSIFWDILILPKGNQNHAQNYVELGKYNAKLEKGIPFYKPYSKLFDI